MQASEGLGGQSQIMQLENDLPLHVYISVGPELALAFCTCFAVPVSGFDPEAKEHKFVDES